MTDSNFVMHIPCEKCGSSDAASLYDDGHVHCFACGKTYNGEGMDYQPTEKKPRELLPTGDFISLTSRGLTKETCSKWGYSVATVNGEPVQIANYRDQTGAIVAQKVRKADKSFYVTGDAKAMGLYGMHLWRDGGKRVVITEGEVDALTVSQVFNNKWPVVSLPNGAQGAAKAIAKNLDWLERFDEVVLMFDNDKPGHDAVQECAVLFTPGKCKIATLPLKDASDMMKAGREKDIAPAVFDAKAFRPDGIINAVEIKDSVLNDANDLHRFSFPWKKLNEMTEGYGYGEVVMWCSGSGMGKSHAVRQAVEYDLLTNPQYADVKIGLLRLEEGVKRAARGIMGLYLKRPIHRRKHWEAIPEADRAKAFEATLGSGRVFLYDHFGSTKIENLMARIRYMAKGCGCKVIVLDHISIVVSGEDEGDERRLIDNLMTALATTAQECGIVLHVITHLKRPAGDKGHEDGARTSLSQLRGSHAIAQLSHTVIGLERNQQDEKTKHITTIRVLKCRETGDTGEAGWLAYDPDSGWLSEIENNPFADLESNRPPETGEDPF